MMRVVVPSTGIHGVTRHQELALNPKSGGFCPNSSPAWVGMGSMDAGKSQRVIPGCTSDPRMSPATLGLKIPILEGFGSSGA